MQFFNNINEIILNNINVIPKKPSIISSLTLILIFCDIYAAETSDAIIHFIKTGSSDSILIESSGHFALIDSSIPYINAEVVVAADIDTSKGEVDATTDSKSHSVNAVLNYLANKGVKILDWILPTHNHYDHIGGMPAVAYKYVDSTTKYYYRSYRPSSDDTENVKRANKKYYTAAYESMKQKGA